MHPNDYSFVERIAKHELNYKNIQLTDSNVAPARKEKNFLNQLHLISDTHPKITFITDPRDKRDDEVRDLHAKTDMD